jgi:uncharacterized membrane protein
MADAIQNKEKIEAMKKLFKHIAWIVILFPLVYGAVIWNSIPSRIAMHFDLQGHADRYGSKIELIFLLLLITAVNIGTYLLLTNVHRIDPMRYGTTDNNSMKRLAFAISLFISAFLCFFLYNAGNDELHFFPGFIFVGTGVLFSVMGNYFYNIKPNYFAGFRLPWALQDPENWRQTHHLAGKLWFGGGILIVIAGILLKGIAAWIAYGAILLVMVVIPVFFSWNFFKKHRTINN